MKKIVITLMLCSSAQLSLSQISAAGPADGHYGRLAALGETVAIEEIISEKLDPLINLDISKVFLEVRDNNIESNDREIGWAFSNVDEDEVSVQPTEESIEVTTKSEKEPFLDNESTA